MMAVLQTRWIRFTLAGAITLLELVLSSRMMCSTGLPYLHPLAWLASSSPSGFCLLLVLLLVV